MRLQKRNGEIQLSRSIGNVQRSLRTEKAAAVIGSSRRQEAARGFSWTRCICVTELESLSNIVGKPDEVVGIDVLETSIRNETESYAIAKREVGASWGFVSA